MNFTHNRKFQIIENKKKQKRYAVHKRNVTVIYKVQGRIRYKHQKR